MGLISHEVPFLLTGGMYEGVDADRPLEAGMVLSVETTMLHPRRGFIKLEDTVVVTADGCEMLGDRGFVVFFAPFLPMPISRGNPPNRRDITRYTNRAALVTKSKRQERP